MNEVNKLGPILTNVSPPGESQRRIEESGGESFGKILENTISEVNRLQNESEEQIKKLMTGEVQDVHTALIAVQKADLSFQMMMQVRNKIVQAYEEIMRMPV